MLTKDKNVSDKIWHGIFAKAHRRQPQDLDVNSPDRGEMQEKT